jgi:hypothetical protein
VIHGTVHGMTPDQFRGGMDRKGVGMEIVNVHAYVTGGTDDDRRCMPFGESTCQ